MSRGGQSSRLTLVSALLVAFALLIAVRWLTRGEKARAVAPMDVAEASAIQPSEPLRAPEDEEPSDAALRLAFEGRSQPDPPAALALAIEPPDDLGSIVWGTVLDQEQVPVEKAYVSFTDRLGERIHGQTDSEGHYSVSGLRTGRWFVEAGATGFLSVESWMQFDDSAPRVQRDFQLEHSVRLIVRVLTPDGRPFHEVDQEMTGGRWIPLIPVATREPPSAPFLTHRGSWQQRFGAGRLGNNVPSSPPGAVAELEVLEPLPVHVSLLLYQEVLATQVANTGQEEVVFVLDVDEAARHLGSFVLTLVDSESGVPLTEATVVVGQSAGVIQPGKVASTGQFQLLNRPPGRYDFHILARDHASERQWLDLPPGTTVERTIALSPGVAIQGRVVDENQQPFAAEIQVGPLPQPGELTANADRAFIAGRSTKGDGTFDLKDLGPGRWLLQFEDRRDPGSRNDLSHMSANIVVDTSAGPVTDLVVRADPVGNLVATWSGPDREDVELRFMDELGLVRARRRFWSAGPNRFALPQGTWHMRVLDREKAIVEERDLTLGVEPIVLELGH
jgi:hypothetical protein